MEYEDPFRYSDYLELQDYFAMTGNPHHPDAPLFAAANHPYHAAGTHQQSNSGFWGAGNQLSGVGYAPLPAVNPTNDFASAGNQLNSNNLALMNGNNVHASPRYSDTLLESEFSRLSLMPGVRPAAPTPGYEAGGNSSSSNRNYSILNENNGGGGASFCQPQLRDIQRMRIQSAARGQVGLYMQPPTHSDFEFDEFSMNAGFSSYAYNTSGLYTGNTNSSLRSLNGYNHSHESQSHMLRNSSSSSYDFGLQNSLSRSNNICSMNNFHEYKSVDLNNGTTHSVDWRNGPTCRPRQRSSFSSLKDLRGKIFSVAKDQHGCRFLQTKFEEGKPEDIHMIFVEIKDHICELMVDQFGNYLVQKFFAACNQDQMTQLLTLVINDQERFKDICVDSHGTRSVQKLLEFLTTAEQRSRVISVLRRITVPLTKSMNGHHVIQYCLKHFSVEENEHILNVVADNCMEIALDKSGCCVLQQCVEHSVGQPRERLITEITSNAILLSEHPYGNYVVQYILGLKIAQATTAIIGQLSGNMVSLSMSKYGSNVVEKFLKDDPDETQVVPIIHEIINSPNFLRLLQDPFGNYVAQSALRASKGVVRNVMASLIMDNYSNLHSHPHGKRVLASVKGNGKIRV